MKTKELVGKRFGRQTVIAPSDRRGFVVVRCDCGKIHEVRAYNLTANCSPTLSCGCLRKEKAAEVGRDVAKRYLRREPNKGNSTGVRGVSEKRQGHYVAQICVHYQRIYLGTFDTIEEAKSARESAERQYFKPIIEGAYEHKHF